jgi:aldose sugar dehydrogenase
MKTMNTSTNRYTVTFKVICLLSLSWLVLFSCSKKSEPTAPENPPLTGTPELTTTTVLSNQGIIWGFDVLPNGNLLFTQKAGAIQLYDTATRSNTSLSALPANISAAGQGGLLDIAVAPDFQRPAVFM